MQELSATIASLNSEEREQLTSMLSNIIGSKASNNSASSASADTQPSASARISSPSTRSTFTKSTRSRSVRECEKYDVYDDVLEACSALKSEQNSRLLDTKVIGTVMKHFYISSLMGYASMRFQQEEMSFFDELSSVHHWNGGSRKVEWIYSGNHGSVLKIKVKEIFPDNYRFMNVLILFLLRNADLLESIECTKEPEIVVNSESETGFISYSIIVCFSDSVIDKRAKVECTYGVDYFKSVDSETYQSMVEQWLHDILEIIQYLNLIPKVIGRVTEMIEGEEELLEQLNTIETTEDATNDEM